MQKKSKDKKDNPTLKETCKQLEQIVATMGERLSEAERYKRRWCLRLYGLPEQESEDIKSKVSDICMQLPLELGDGGKMAIDVAHRLGRREGNREPAVIILFAFRWMRGLIWMKAKNSAHPKERKLGEDLTKMEKQMRVSTLATSRTSPQRRSKSLLPWRAGFYRRRGDRVRWTLN